jgi:effector-binding domain-containing protein
MTEKKSINSIIKSKVKDTTIQIRFRYPENYEKVYGPLTTWFIEEELKFLKRIWSIYKISPDEVLDAQHDYIQNRMNIEINSIVLENKTHPQHSNIQMDIIKFSDEIDVSSNKLVAHIRELSYKLHCLFFKQKIKLTEKGKENYKMQIKEIWGDQMEFFIQKILLEQKKEFKKKLDEGRNKLKKIPIFGMDSEYCGEKK